MTDHYYFRKRSSSAKTFFGFIILTTLLAQVTTCSSHGSLNDHGENLMKLYAKGALIGDSVQNNLLPLILLYRRYEWISFRNKQALVHSNKLTNLSLDKDEPLLSENKLVINHGLNHDLPKYVRDSLLLGPKGAVLDKINPKNVLAESDHS